MGTSVYYSSKLQSWWWCYCKYSLLLLLTLYHGYQDHQWTL